MMKDAYLNRTREYREKIMHPKTSQALLEKVCPVPFIAINQKLILNGRNRQSHLCNKCQLQVLYILHNSLCLVYKSGFQVNVVASEYYVKRDSGLIYRDYEVGKGDCPKDGQQVFFCLFCIVTAMLFFLHILQLKK